MSHQEREETNRNGSGEINRRSFLRSTGVAAGAGGLFAAGATPAEASDLNPHRDAFDEAHSSNFTSTSRTASDIKWIVVHATEGPYSSAINWFKNPDSDVSAHYVISNYDHTWGEPGHCTQMVRNSDIGYHALGSNSHSIGIEHEWDPSEGRYFTDACYQKSAQLIEWLADTYNIPLDWYDHPSAMCENDGGIITHRHAPQSYTGSGHCGTLTDKVCPGPDFDENDLFSYIDGSSGGGGGGGIDDEFEEDDRVVTTAESLNGRDAPTLDSTVVQTLPEGTTGDIVGGPEYADAITWWQVWVPVYGTTVWCSGNFLEESDMPEPDDGDPMDFTIETNLNRRLNATGAEIDAAIEALSPDSPLIGLGGTIVDVQNEFTIDALYILAHAVHESAWGTSDIAQDHNNLFGYGASDDDPYGNAAQYDSFEECVWEVMEEVKELYLTPGDWRYNGPHLSGMNVYYATDPEWDVKTADHYLDLAAQIDDLQVIDEDDGVTDPDDPDIADFSEGDRVETSTSTTAWAGDDDLSLSAGESGEISPNEYLVEDGSVYWSTVLDDHGWWWIAQGALQPEGDDPTGDDWRFENGDQVVTTASMLNGREQPHLDSDVVEVLPEGTTGEIMNGPEFADDITWWGLYVPESDEYVWCSGNYLEADDGSVSDPVDDGATFSMGESVVTTASNLNGRRRPHLDSDVLRVLPQGTAGEVMNGPQVSNDITWWGLYVPTYDVYVWCSEAYLESDGSGGTTDGKFDHGDQVISTAYYLSGREQPGLNAEVEYELPEGTVATVVNGPEEADDITWWGLHVEHDGACCTTTEYWVWCSENYLEEHTTSGSGFQMGQSVYTTSDLNGRERPYLDSNVLQVLPEGTTGEIMNGPTESDDITWWGLYVPEYDEWVWCSGNYLASF